MAMKRITQLSVLLSLLLTTALLSCNGKYGKKIKVAGTRGEIFYKEGVNEEQAKKLGEVLKEEGFLGPDKAASIQAMKEGGDYTVRFVYDRDYYEKNGGFEKEFREYA